MERLNLPEQEQNKIKTAQQLYAVLSGKRVILFLLLVKKINRT